MEVLLVVYAKSKNIVNLFFSYLKMQKSKSEVDVDIKNNYVWFVVF